MTTWVFLRGLIRESRHWGDFPRVFREANAGAEIVMLDFPGTGILNGSASLTSVDAMADFCQAEMVRRDVRPPYRLLGLSLGGMVATSWAERHPLAVSACVLINTSARPFCSVTQRLLLRNWPTMIRLALPGASVEAREQAILDMTSHAHANDPTLLAEWVRYGKEKPVTRSNLIRQLLAAALYRAPHGSAPVPTLVLASTRDAMVDVRCSRAFASARGGTLVEHPAAGHDLPLDDGAWVADQVRYWSLR